MLSRTQLTRLATISTCLHGWQPLHPVRTFSREAWYFCFFPVSTIIMLSPYRLNVVLLGQYHNERGQTDSYTQAQSRIRTFVRCASWNIPFSFVTERSVNSKVIYEEKLNYVFLENSFHVHTRSTIVRNCNACRYFRVLLSVVFARELFFSSYHCTNCYPRTTCHFYALQNFC